MITAVDSDVLLDFLGADPRFGPSSTEALRRCLSEGGLVACEVVWVEVSAAFASLDDTRQALGELGGALQSYRRTDDRRRG